MLFLSQIYQKVIGPVNLTGKITVEETANLTVFGEIAVGTGAANGELIINGTLDIRWADQ